MSKLTKEFVESEIQMPITSITKDMVEQRHHELTVSPNRRGTSGDRRQS